MKKILLFFAAMLVAFAAYADPIQPGNGTLSAAISAAQAGDVIELATGEFTEGSSIGLSQNITIQAAEGDTPVVKVKFGIQGGARVTFKGIKFDASVATNHLIYANDATEGNELILEDCEIYDYTPVSSLIHCGASEKIKACTFINCYFHNIHKSCYFNENTNYSSDLTVTNCTFANITTASSYYAGVLDTRATSGKVRIDQCTFYNVQVISTDYAAIGKVGTSNSVVSNCIFAMPASTGSLRAIRDVSTANNCLTYNYTKDSNRGIHDDVAKNNCIYGDDPLFTDAANDDFTLAETSPAHEAGMGGTHLGDPRWWPASWQPVEIVEVTAIELNKSSINLNVDDVEALVATVSPDDATDPSVSWTSSNNAIATVNNGLVSAIAEGVVTITATAGEKSATCEVTVSAAAIPNVDFAIPYTLSGKIAHLEGAIWKNSDYKLYGDGGSNKHYGNAYWTIHVTRPCVVTGVLNGLEGGHLYELDVFLGEDSITTVNQSSAAWSSGDKDLDAPITFASAGDYIFRLRNTQEWSSGKVAGITLTPKYTIAGDMNGWTAEGMTKVGANLYKATFSFTGEKQFKLIDGGDWKGYGDYTVNTTLSNVTVGDAGEANNHNYVVSLPTSAPVTIDIYMNPEEQQMYAIVDYETLIAVAVGDATFGLNGTPAEEGNEMTANGDGTFTLVKNNVTLTEGTNYWYKVALFHSWDENFGDPDNETDYHNKYVNVAQSGIYNVTFNFDWNTKAVSADVELVEIILPYMAIIGDMNGWAGTELVPAENKLTASCTIHLDMNENSGYGFKILIGDKAYCIVQNPWYAFHRNWTSASNITTVAGNDDGFWLQIDIEGDYTFTWTIAENKLDITFPEQPVAPTLEDGYYLIGKINGVNGWNLSDLSDARLLTVNPNDEDEYLIDFTFDFEDEFKIVKIEDNSFISEGGWFPGEGGNYQIDANHTGLMNIKFRPDYSQTTWFGNCIYVNPAPYVRKNAVAGKWGTICLPWNATLENANAYYLANEITAGLEENDEVEVTSIGDEGEVLAGKTYLIKAIADGDIIANFNLNANKQTSPIYYNNLMGNLAAENETIYATSEEYDYYILSGNEFHHLEGTASATIAQYKGYLRIAKSPSGAPAVLRIVEGEQSATSIEGLNANETATKFIQNGVLYILRDGVVYDAMGKMVK